MPEKLRSTAREAVIAATLEGATYGHQRNYHKLHIYRDGRVGWTEHANRSDDIVDGYAERFAAVPCVACEGTGSCPCDCGFCTDEKYADADEAIADAVDCLESDDLADLEAAYLIRFDAIPADYFSDEGPRR